jgi:hypothetical protein
MWQEHPAPYSILSGTLNPLQVDRSFQGDILFFGLAILSFPSCDFPHMRAINDGLE